MVVIEPSDLAMFRGEYEKFLESRSYERLSGVSYEVCEYVYGLVTNDSTGADALASGTSCSDQLDALLERKPRHPIDLIAPDAE